jgi:hypothetical protein
MNKLSNGDLLFGAQRIQEKLSIPEYGAVQPSPAEVLPVLEKFKLLHYRCEARDYSLIAARNQCRHEVLQLLRQQCESVNAIAWGNVKLLEMSGFPLRKPKSPTVLPAQTWINSVNPGVESGSIVVRLKPIPNCKYYIVTVVNQDGTSSEHISLKSKVLIENLSPATFVSISARAFNSAGGGFPSLTKVVNVPGVPEREHS